MVKLRLIKGLFLRGVLLLGLLSLTLTAACGGETITKPEEGETLVPEEGEIVFAYDAWTGTHLPIYVLKTIFEDELGYTVKVVELSVAAAYEQVALGGVHIYTDGWFPVQDSIFDKYPNLVKLGQCYGGKAKDAYEGWLVPTDFARKYSLTHVKDLRNPTVAKALDTDGDGKGNLIGAPEAWNASKCNDGILSDYELTRLYEQEHGSERKLMEAIEERLSRGEPALFYLCLPNAYPAKVPLSASLTWLEGTEERLPLSFVRGVVRGEFIVNHPEAAKILSKYKISGTDISWSMEQIAKKGESTNFLTELAQTWIEQNRGEVNKWLEGIEVTPTPTPPPEALTIAYSPEKEDLFLKLVLDFNLSRPADVLPIHPIRADMAYMLDDAVDGRFGAISPDCSIWLAQLDKMWQERNPGASPLVGTITRYAVSPIVIAMWESTARDMGYPGVSLGWEDLMQRAVADPDFKWSHPSARTASGLLTVTAECYAGAGKLADLTSEDLKAETTTDYVMTIESTVQRYGGESEDRVAIRILAEGGYPLDAFVAQEQLVIYFNRNTTGENLVAIYPKEGTFWMDHPLVLLEGTWVTEEHRRAFRSFAEFVTELEQQRLVLGEGYRPGVLAVSLEEEGSLIKPEYKVDAEEPKTLLKVPSPAIVSSIRDVWRLTKKPANIYLVVDVSGSMERDRKLENAKDALLSFIDQIEGDRDRVALIAFSDEVHEIHSLAPVQREDINRKVQRLEAGGGTELYDAVAYAINKLQQQGDTERINVIVAMTDGISEGSISVVESSLRGVDFPVLIFTVAYGENADLEVLKEIARLGDGQAYPSDPGTIEKLYELISRFF